MRQRYRFGLRLGSFQVAAAIGVAACVALPAFGAPPYAVAPPAAPGGHTFEARGRVIGVDPDTNSVTIRSARGRRFTFAIEPEVADVSQFAPGDRIDVMYRRASLLRLDAPGSTGIRSSVETTTTAPGDSGETATTHSVDVSATVMRVDRANRRLTLRGPTETVELDVPPNLPIDALRVGQQVLASYETGSAVRVTREGMPVH